MMLISKVQRLKNDKFRAGVVDYLTFFSSAGTLICCALPALLVSIGLGATMVGLVSTVPGLIWVSENKDLVFTFSALMLGLSGTIIWRNRNIPCPTDPKLRETCLKGRRYSRNIFFVSLFLFLIGFIFAFIAPNFL